MNQKYDDLFKTYSHFKNVVEERQIDLFKEKDDVDNINVNNNFKVLYKLYKQLVNPETKKRQNKNIADDIGRKFYIIFADIMTHLESTTTIVNLQRLKTNLAK